MAKNNILSNKTVFANIIRDLAISATTSVETVTLLEGKRSGGSGQRSSVSVYFLTDDKVTIDLYVNIELGVTIPDVVCVLQERVKSAIENATRYKVHSVNVHIVSVYAED